MTKKQRKMKKIVLVLSMMMPMAIAMMAQEEMKAPRMFDGKSRIERMASELNLTPAQREKMEKIFGDEMKQMRKMGEKMRSEREKTDKKVMKVLTPEQQLKYGKMKERHARHMGQGMGPRHDGKMGPRHDGKMGPRHHGKKGPRHDGKIGELHEDGQLLAPPQNGNDSEPIKWPMWESV